MSNKFVENNRESKRFRHLMPSFFATAFGDAKIKYYDDLRDFGGILQTMLHVDGTIEVSDCRVQSFEEKLVNWPANEKPYSRLYCETDSCSLAGFHSDGWMKTSFADWLIYQYETPYCLYILCIPFLNGLKFWFWENLPKKRGSWPPHRNPEENESQGRLVPIKEIRQAFPETKCFLLSFQGVCKQTELDMEEVVKRYQRREKVTRIEHRITTILSKSETITETREAEDTDPFQNERDMAEAERLLQSRADEY